MILKFIFLILALFMKSLVLSPEWITSVSKNDEECISIPFFSSITFKVTAYLCTLKAIDLRPSGP